MNADHTDANWKPVRPSALDVDPSLLVEQVPRLAKDVDYARAVQDAWRQELTPSRASESRPLCYKVAEDGTVLYGTLVRCIPDPPLEHAKKVPGILLFHTGAGPHDVFLQWKADSLVTNADAFPDGAVVLICDILSDSLGWAWSSDRSRYNSVREKVLDSLDGNGTRIQLQRRIRAALEAITSLAEVDGGKLAAMGWCLGGHSVLELARMQVSQVRAMVTFHGVFDGIPPSANQPTMSPNRHRRVLLCNGKQDPFVPSEAIEAAMSTFTHHGFEVDLLNLEGARHGFTNPAQDFNPNPAFRFNQEAAKLAWSAALELTKSQLQHD